MDKIKLSDFKILSQRLVKTEFELNKNFVLKNENNIKLDIHTDININKNEKDRQAVVHLTLKVFEKENNTEYPFFMILENEGRFTWSEDLQDVNNYLEINAPSILISYLRSVVSQLTSFAGFPPLILPLINFTKE